MSSKWFHEYKWIYLPVSWQGFLTTALVFLFNLQVFAAIDQGSHSVSDTLYGIFPYLVSSFVVLFWIASKTSKPKK